jgi:hypothetical protein
MSDTNISDEGCRRCERLEDQLEAAEKKVKTLRAELHESYEYRDGLAAKIIEMEGAIQSFIAVLRLRARQQQPSATERTS